MAYAQPVRTGAEVLVASDFAALDGLRVGLITNHTAVVDTADGGPRHLIDRLAQAPNVTLAALFGPEHGLRGTAEAGEAVRNGRDAATGVPVYSLYGATRKPTPAMLADLDVLVFDIQDIGARFYTYIATMGLAMQAAAEAGLPFIVLDRPNPLGRRADGPLREPAFDGFLGPYPIPIQHGLTVGELARMVQGERWVAGLSALDLRVVAMQGWDPAQPWPDGLAFLAPSPNIPDLMTAQVYPGTCLFEGTTATEGRGTEAPFRLIGAPGLDGVRLAADLNARRLPGVRFEAATFTPRDWPGRVTDPKHEGVRLGGVRLVVTDAAGFRPVEAGVHLLDAVYRWTPPAERRRFFDARRFDTLAGTRTLRRQLQAHTDPSAIVASWADAVAAFEQRATPYRLYP